MEYSQFQKNIFNWVQNGSGNAVVRAVAGSGKCLGRNTPVLMANGSIKFVQDIRVGDTLMGDDSTPRTVSSVCSGKEQLYEIIPQKGDSFICNESHILTLKQYIRTKSKFRIIDIELKKLLDLNSKIHQNGNFKYFKLKRCSVDFPEKKVEIDPYIVGLWLGDGHFNHPRINHSCPKVRSYLNQYNWGNGIVTKEYVDKKNNTFVFSFTKDNLKGDQTNYVRDFFKSISNKNEKYIPEDYLINSREVRLALLAGLIDSDGSLDERSCSYTTKSSLLKDCVLYLCRSLGFAAYSSIKICKIKDINFEAPYFRINISGDFSSIPTLSKKTIKRKQIKDVLVTGFKVRRLKHGDYYGFTIDKNGRFLLGDFTVTHNTTTLIESLTLIPKNKRVCLLAFNKSIAEELKRRTPTHINVQTFHSLGWSVMRTHLDNPVLDDKKVYNHIQLLFKQKRISFKDFSQKIKISNNIKKIIDFLRLNLVETPSSLDINQICIDQDIEILDNEVSLSLQLYTGIIEDDSCYDFVDMLFIPVFRKLKFPKFDWVFTDECQDASIIQQKMMELCIAEGGRFMAVGDPSQSLYAFAGADADAYDNFVNQPNTIQLPLSICYRCGSSIIKEAQKLVPEIQHWDKNGVGQIVENGSIKNVKDGDVVLCRINFPLAALAGNFLRENKKVSILGSDFGKNLSKLIESCKGTSTADLFSFLSKKLQKIYDEIVQENSFVDPNTQPEYQLMLDKINTIRALSENCENIKEVLIKIQTIFSDSVDKTGILLSTVHKFKGRESENVYIIEPQLIPFPYYLHLPNQAEVENNIKYVAITRAKNKLEYIRDWTAYTKDETKRKSRPKNKLRNKSYLPLQDEDEGHDHG